MSRATSGSGRDGASAYSCERFWRPISIRSSNAASTKRPTRAPFFSSNELVATVELYVTKWGVFSSSNAFIPATTACAGSCGVDSSLCTLISPPIIATKSVKVPPVSTPTTICAELRRRVGLRTAMLVRRPEAVPCPKRALSGLYYDIVDQSGGVVTCRREISIHRQQHLEITWVAGRLQRG